MEGKSEKTITITKIIFKKLKELMPASGQGVNACCASEKLKTIVNWLNGLMA